MVEVVQMEEELEEYENRRGNEKIGKKPVSEIKKEEKEVKVEKSTVYGQRIQQNQVGRSSEIKIPPLKGYDSIGKTEKLAPIIFRTGKSIELKIQPLKEFSKIKYPTIVKPAFIEKEDYSPKLIIPSLRGIMPIACPSIIPPRKILKTDTSKLIIPLVTFERIPYHKPVLLIQPIVKLVKEEMREEMEHIEPSNVESPEAFSSNIKAEEIPEFLDLIFSEGNGAQIESGKPIIIFLEELEGDSHIGVLRTICKRIFREKEGGNPEPTIISDTEDLKKELGRLKAENKIFSVQLDDKEWDEIIKEEQERIFNKIDALFSQGAGFIIFNTFFPYHPTYHRIKIAELKPKKLSIEFKMRISEVAWGFIEIEETANFDLIFETARDLYEQALENIKKERLGKYRGIYWDATKPNEGKESLEHRMVKSFLMKYLIKKLIKEEQLPPEPDILQIEDKIKTEVDTKAKLEGIIADVMVGSEVYEVETLFSEDRDGKDIRDKITHSIRKYKDKPVKKINIVLENLTFLRHIKDLVDIKRNYASWQKKHDKSIEFFTLKLRNNEIIKLEDVIKELRKITEKEMTWNTQDFP